MVPTCQQAYFRPGSVEPVLCHKPRSHSDNREDKDHSWEALRRADSTRLQPVYPETGYTGNLERNEPIKLLQAIERGDWDAYLEDVLEAAHRRKRLNREARTGRRHRDVS